MIMISKIMVKLVFYFFKKGDLMDFPVIDLKATGKKLKVMCKQAGYTPIKLKRILGLGCVQTVYKWFQGENVPSIENFYALSLLLGVQMEEILVFKNVADHSLFWQKNVFLIKEENLYFERRKKHYICKIMGISA